MSVWCYCTFCGRGFWWIGTVLGSERVICDWCRELEGVEMKQIIGLIMGLIVGLIVIVLPILHGNYLSLIMTVPFAIVATLLGYVVADDNIPL